MFCFTDLIGAWHHLTFPIEELSEKSFDEGFGFDGSSSRAGHRFTSRTCCWCLMPVVIGLIPS